MRVNEIGGGSDLRLFLNALGVVRCMNSDAEAISEARAALTSLQVFSAVNGSRRTGC